VTEDSSTDDGQLNVGLLMYVAARSLEARAYDALVAGGADDITPTQARLMAQIDRDGTRVVTLAARARTTKQSAAFLVDQLERAGYVERVPDPADGRARLVRVAERGLRSVEASRSIVAEVEAEWTAHVGERRMAQLRGILTDLREITDPWR